MAISKRKTRQFIQKTKFYAWYYRGLEVNLIPVAFLTREEAEFTISKNYGPKVFETLKIISGVEAIKREWKLGVNSFPHNGEWVKLKTFFMPMESSYKKSARTTFRRRIYERMKNSQVSTLRKIEKYYYSKSYGRKDLG